MYENIIVQSGFDSVGLQLSTVFFSVVHECSSFWTFSRLDQGHISFSAERRNQMTDIVHVVFTNKAENIS
ncbi:Uncharacterized protein APZ42_017910 [Daphnia magna]|uniref:Uncharacterized protein n=1 Tax=Daphnia magna TaxID=35525 RepID=A0A164ZDZ9_9CRUS|nr:Uncharacterized protein APZ42_017910 [Daphnia magna]